MLAMPVVVGATGVSAGCVVRVGVTRGVVRVGVAGVWLEWVWQGRVCGHTVLLGPWDKGVLV